MEHPIKRPSWDEHIKDLFVPDDAGCMGWAMDLRSYVSVKANAAKISEWIGSGRMPPPDEGRSWSDDQLATFRNWATNTGFAEKPFVRLKPSASPRVRRSIHALEADEINLLKKAFEGIMARDGDLDNAQSFFKLAGIHWLPTTDNEAYCRHHDDAYNPWHRAYLMAFEDALRSVEGCEDVTLPYWDILGDTLPDWVYDAPFYGYKYPHDLTGFDGSTVVAKGLEISRFGAAAIKQNVTDESDNIADKISEALNAKEWRGFNGWGDWGNRHEGIIRAHDNGHGVCGDTIADQNVAAFDPLFWFFHCNWDRLWWKWQSDHNLRSLIAFQSVVEGDANWLKEAPETLLAPFDVNSAEMIDLSAWKVDYEHPPEETFPADVLFAASTESLAATSSFAIPTTQRLAVRVNDINRLDIPGSFLVMLVSGEDVIAKTSVFQPSEPRACANCTKHGEFGTEFIVTRDKLPAETPLRVAIKVRKPGGMLEDFPLERAGNPTVSISVMLSAS